MLFFLWGAAMGLTSTEQRWDIVRVWKACKSIYKTAKQLHVSYAVAKRWVERYKATLGVQHGPKSGRRRLLSDSAMEAALALLLDQVTGTARNVAQELKRQGITDRVVDKKTVIRGARLAAEKKGTKIRVVRGRPIKMLPANTRHKRLSFGKKHLRTNFNNVMFTDRKKFLFLYPGTSVGTVSWVREGQRRQALQVNHALCVNVYAGITRYGMTRLHVVAGTSQHDTTFHNKQGSKAKNITAEEYKHVLEATLLPEGTRVFRTHGISSWVFQQDNDPTHRSAADIIVQYNKRHGTSISLLPNWPPSSPDLSLIENVWGYMQARLNARGCKTFQEFQAAVHQEARDISRDHARNLFASMGQRLRSCVRNGGDRTNY